jgi:hypothetical protein
MRHKLVAFIIKNPPGGSSANGGSSKSRKGRRGQKGSSESVDASNEQSAEDDEDEMEDEDDGGDELAKKFAAEAAQLKQSNSQLDDWSQDMSEEAIARRQVSFLLSLFAGSLTRYRVTWEV